MAHNFYTFVKDSGLKVLSVIDLSKVQHKAVLYLLHGSVSGMDYLLTTTHEFADLIDADPDDLQDGINDLASRNIITVKYKYSANVLATKQLYRLNLNFNLHKWLVQGIKQKSPKEALVYPFMRSEGAALQVVENKAEIKKEKNRLNKSDAVKVIVEEYVKGRSLTSDEIESAFASADVLYETHPLEQILLLLKYFDKRIETLSLLASSWQQYIDLMDQETHKIDIFDARSKQQEINQKIRDSAEEWLQRDEELKLTQDEIQVLKILKKHQYPRRQLYWAYQARNSYPNLNDFFAAHHDLMLSVTNTGVLVKNPE